MLHPDTPEFDPERQLEAIFNAFPDLLFWTRFDGTILHYRAGDPALLYSSPEQFLGKTMQAILPPEVGDLFEKALRKANATGQVSGLKYKLTTSKGERWFDARLVPEGREHVIVLVRDITEHVHMSERSRLQLRQLTALHAIDAAISSSFDLTVTLSVILREVINQLAVDAADVLLFNSRMRMLEFAAGKGFRMPEAHRPAVRVGEGYAGIAVLERRTVSLSTLPSNWMEGALLPDFNLEGFMSYYAVPLIAKGQVKGVLEIYHRSPLTPQEDWLEFLGMLASQAALAIDSASMFLDLQNANAELGMAYDAMIESWSKALEVSGREDRIHIRNVIKLTEQLSRQMGIQEDELVHIRRGALLHDVGKIGISDQILNRPGPLDEKEWEIVRRHPQMAGQILSTVAYLAPALKIPLYHHERWDGSGYPNGLLQDQIPLPARIFSVVDVYDSLTSERPFRSAWPVTRALEHVRQEAGRHFDPTVVKAFLQMMGA
ncbi:MAG: HD domain-containing protein [Anaerolineales bacterium]|nr:HD domain-containing protein [Anaerolineales bacterium]